jgi:hypothetical protein
MTSDPAAHDYADLTAEIERLRRRTALLGAVDNLLDGERLTRVLAQVEITFSNPMINAFWRSLKHGWIYLHTLDSLAALRWLITFYVKAHNEVMPHSAFEGPTPYEFFSASAMESPRSLLTRARRLARSGWNQIEP